MSAKSTFYDGDYSSPQQSGPVVPWQDNETRSTLYTVTLQQLAAKWKRAAMGMKGPKSSVLVEEDEPTDKGVGIIEWTRTFAEVPASRGEVEEYSYGYQGINGTSIYELPLGVTAITVYDYFHTTQPDKIKLLTAYRIVQAGSDIVFVGVPPKPGAKQILAENAQISRWRGNIYVRKLIYVPAFQLSLISS